MSVFISIIIPTYNRAHLIQNVLKSVINQTETDWEIILVDDGSTDNTKELVQSIGDERIKYHYKENGERGAARNFGIEKANGKYLFFLDSDDSIKPNYISYAKELAEESKNNCIHIPYNLKTIDGEIQGPFLPNNIHKAIQQQNLFGCQVIVKKECVDTIRFSENREFKIGEDWFFILQLNAKYSFHIGKLRLGIISQHDDRSMNTAPAEEVLKSRDIFISELKHALPFELQLQKNVWYELTNLASLHAAIRGNKKLAWKLLRITMFKKVSKIFRRRNLAILKKIIFS